MRKAAWVALLGVIALGLATGIPRATGTQVKTVDTLLGPPVSVPAGVPDKPQGITPLVLFLGNVALVVYDDPTTLDEVDYVEIFHLQLGITAGIAWMKGGILFLVEDEGLARESTPTGTMIYAPPRLRDTM